MFKKVSRIYLSIILVKLVQCSCEVFKTITTSNTGQRLIELDLSSLVTLDYAWGVWTKYSKFYVSVGDLSLPIQIMHVLTEKKQDITYLVYYIILNQEEKSFTHCLYLFHGGTYQIRQLKIDQSIAMESQKFLNKIQKFLCKSCYQSINGECVKVNKNCNECDNYHQCISCELNYTLYDNRCLECPLESPNCKYNQTGYYCRECITGYYFNQTLEQCQQCGQFFKVCIYSSILNKLQCVRCIHDLDYFISAEKLNCKTKTFPYCEIEVSEHYLVYFNQPLILQAQQYSNSLDIFTFTETIPVFQVCQKCKNGYINKMLVQQYYECASVESQGSFLPKELKLKVLESKNNDFQLALYSLPQNPQLKFVIIYGDHVNSYSSITTISNPITGGFCNDPNCMVCVKSYVQLVLKMVYFIIINAIQNAIVIPALQKMINHLNTKTVYHGQCHLCPQFCELCRGITEEEKLKINPYFQPDDITLQKYTFQTLKRKIVIFTMKFQLICTVLNQLLIIIIIDQKLQKNKMNFQVKMLLFLKFFLHIISTISLQKLIIYLMNQTKKV
ncbi:unnamed protein product [Paramecium primaurelia]|uniref:Transmembrane protein n=1 Tax=Paramecium primaurelia TaxID=5886 RepID=A0A8S1KMX1_PARPR|nr:unnamed protein product [Paramecium primaurelia]